MSARERLAEDDSRILLDGFPSSQRAGHVMKRAEGWPARYARGERRQDARIFKMGVHHVAT